MSERVNEIAALIDKAYEDGGYDEMGYRVNSDGTGDACIVYDLKHVLSEHSRLTAELATHKELVASQKHTIGGLCGDNNACRAELAEANAKLEKAEQFKQIILGKDPLCSLFQILETFICAMKYASEPENAGEAEVTESLFECWGFHGGLDEADDSIAFAEMLRTILTEPEGGHDDD